MDISRLPVEARQRRRAEIRAFLRSRRARVTPADVGMPAGSGRRTSGLRREEVAVLAGVGVSWYTWLEQGREINVSGEVLDAIARVLRLEPSERVHLYLLAGLNPPPVDAGSDAGQPALVPDALRRVVDGWLPRPAYLIDRHWNFVAVNDAARAVFGYGVGDHNCLVSFFMSEATRSSMCQWQDAARALVGQLRADAARYPDDPWFGRLAADMCAASPAFADLWAEHQVGSAAQGLKALRHDAVGEMVFEYTTLPLPDLPGHRLMLYTPAPDGDTGERLARLLETVGTVGAEEVGVRS